MAEELTQAEGLESGLAEQMAVRREHLESLARTGQDPFGSRFDRNATAASIQADFGHLPPDGEGGLVRVAGRISSRRGHGKATFMDLVDLSGRIQLYLKIDEVGEDSYRRLDLVDLGDLLTVTGTVFRTRRGELSVRVREWAVAAKALRPPPEKWHGLRDVEVRYRQRYADLLSNAEVRQTFVLRSHILSAIRQYLDHRGFMEVETPTMSALAGGAAARPFITHHNALDMKLYLRIATELYLKRCIVGGLEKVYEIGRIFRNEGIDSTHSAEFTMLEAYQSWGDHRSIAELTRKMIMDAADVVGVHQIERPDGQVIDLDAEWTWLPIYPAISEALGEQVEVDTPVDVLRKYADAHEVPWDPKWGNGKLVMELYEELVEPGLVNPTFVCDFPEVAQPLARRHRSEPGKIEAWDLIIGGVERATGFNELIDPIIQRQILTQQSLAAAAGDPEAMQLDEDFLAALEQGAPPMGGMGMGIDRLIMMFTGAGIRETILFPLLRPQ